MNELNDLRSERKIPPSMKGGFWAKLILAFKEELEEYAKDKVDPIKYLYDIENMDISRLQQLSTMLGVHYDATINSDEEFLRREVEAVPFKILYKGTAVLYKSFVKSLGRQGQMFVYFYKSASAALVRDAISPLLSLPSTVPGSIFIHKSGDNYTGYVQDDLNLDTGLVLDVESEGKVWTLDTSDSAISSNHFGLEYVIDRIITKQVRNSADVLVSKEYLMTQEYLAYVMGNTEFGRRAKEVPHIGSQLCLTTDISETFDCVQVGSAYTIPAIKAKVIARSNLMDLISSVYDISYLEFGIGSHDVSSKNSPKAFPTALAQRVGRTYVLFDERWEDSNWVATCAEYLGQQINYLVLFEAGTAGSPNGTLTSFSFTLPYTPIQRGNVKITFTFDTIERVFYDDKKGNLVSDYGAGTINYSTGACVLNMDFTYTEFVNIATAPKYDDPDHPNQTEYSFEWSNALNPLNAGSCWLYFYTGDGDAQRKYAVQDDGLGHFVHPLIESSTVDYVNRTMVLKFKTPLTPETVLSGKASYHKVCPPDANSQILGNYYFTNRTIEVTEVGMFKNDGTMVAYASFPPLEFSSVKNHCNMMFAIKKTKYIA